MIELENGYVILNDSLNYTIAKKCVAKEKKEDGVVVEKDGYRYLGYYSDLSSAINGYWEMVCKQKLSEGTYSLKEAIEMIKAESRRVANLARA